MFYFGLTKVSLLTEKFGIGKTMLMVNSEHIRMYSELRQLKLSKGTGILLCV